MTQNKTFNSHWKGFVNNTNVLQNFKKSLGKHGRPPFCPALVKENLLYKVGHRDRQGVFHTLGVGSSWNEAIKDATQIVKGPFNSIKKKKKRKNKSWKNKAHSS